VYRLLKEFTMVPELVYCYNLSLAERVKNIPGCVIECGVWRGGMCAGLHTVLGPQRRYFLFDSFEGLPPAQAIDGPAAIRWQQDTTSPFYYDNCSASQDFARRAMEAVGAKQYELKPGFFDISLPNFMPPEPIAFLRLDADWYKPTMECLDWLFDHVAPGGIIALDDYYTWDGCSRALHDFLSKRKARERIRCFADAICYLEKAAA
jgi:O-methyltransferase